MCYLPTRVPNSVVVRSSIAVVHGMRPPHRIVAFVNGMGYRIFVQVHNSRSSLPDEAPSHTKVHKDADVLLRNTRRVASIDRIFMPHVTLIVLGFVPQFGRIACRTEAGVPFRPGDSDSGPLWVASADKSPTSGLRVVRVDATSGVWMRALKHPGKGEGSMTGTKCTTSRRVSGQAAYVGTLSGGMARATPTQDGGGC